MVTNGLKSASSVNVFVRLSLSIHRSLPFSHYNLFQPCRCHHSPDRRQLQPTIVMRSLFCQCFHHCCSAIVTYCHKLYHLDQQQTYDGSHDTTNLFSTFNMSFIPKNTKSVHFHLQTMASFS
jgi:hypothetical protein